MKKSHDIINKTFHLGIYGILESPDHILLVKKTRGPYQGLWDLPGGSPVHGETINETLRREILEETGLDFQTSTFFSNDVFISHFLDKSIPCVLHHTCLIYTICGFDISKMKTHVNFEDVESCHWLIKSNLDQKMLSKAACKILYPASFI